MRIAYVINSVEGGGAALPVPAIASVLRGCGAEVAVFALTRRDGRALPAMREAGLAVQVRDGGRRDHLRAARWLGRELARFRPTHIWTSLTRATVLGQIVGYRLGIPVVSWQHAAWLKPANLRLLRLTHSLSRLWIADSTAVARFCRERIGIAARDLMIWPIFRADPAAPTTASWRRDEPLRIASLGRLHPVKGYDVLIAALALLGPEGSRIELAVAGEGSDRERLADAVAAAGVQTVTFPGYVDDPDGWLARHHLYVQPSRSEGFCVAAHEAMQAGLPVIGSAVGEMAESIVDGVTGWRVPPGDAAALARALGEAVAAPDALAAMGAAARAAVLSRYGPAAFRAAGEAVVARLEELA